MCDLIYDSELVKNFLHASKDTIQEGVLEQWTARILEDWLYFKMLDEVAHSLDCLEMFLWFYNIILRE